MSQNQRPKEKPYFGRAVLQNGDTGVAVGIPAEARDAVGGIEAGEGGDTVDLEWDRENDTVTIFLPDNRNSE